MQLNYKELGQGAPIIILHGLFGMLDNWMAVGKNLAENYSVYILDQRNHGKSPHSPEINYRLMAEDLRQFMEDHWIHKAFILGHSMGGKTAMQFALEYPDMVEKLIVVDIGPWENEAGHDLIFEALRSMDLSSVQTRSDAEDKIGEMINDFGVKQFLLKNLSREKSGTYKWKMNLPAIHENYAEILAAIHSDYPFEGPTLFLNGEKSDYIKKADEPRLKALFPESKLVTVKDAGHWVHADAPQVLISEVEKFLNEE